MHILRAKIVDFKMIHDMKMAKIQIGGAFKWVAADLLPEAKVGDRVVIESGVAIAIEKPEIPKET